MCLCFQIEQCRRKKIVIGTLVGTSHKFEFIIHTKTIIRIPVWPSVVFLINEAMKLISVPIVLRKSAHPFIVRAIFVG